MNEKKVSLWKEDAIVKESSIIKTLSRELNYEQVSSLGEGK